MAAAIAIFAACGGGDDQGTSNSSGEPDGDVSGTWVLDHDSDGTEPLENTTVTLVLADSELSVHAVSPDDELTDVGTYSVSDGRMTIKFNEQGIEAADRPYKVEGDTLEIPVKMFSEGDGSSIWRRSSESAESEPSPDDGDSSPGAGAGGDAGFSTDLEADWSIYDLDEYATAAAMKTFVENLNGGGMAWEDAVKAAADTAKTFDDVDSVVISPNGLNAVIKYKDGGEEDLITERFSTTEGGAVSIAPRVSEPLVSSALLTTATCPALPASPQGVVKVPGGNVAEPGREGLQPKGGYGVTVYNAKAQPKPTTSADSPPSSERNALLFAPLYQVPHPGPRYDKAGNPIVGTWSGFREATDGDDIGCVKAALERAGYRTDLIVGKIEKKKPVHTGIDAIVELTNKLTSTRYGAIYFLTHGSAFDNNIIKLEMGTLGEEEREKVLGNRKINHQEMTTLEDAIREEILNRAGLPLDDDLKRTIRANVEVNGRLELWVSSDFFRLLREKKGLDFSHTLVFVNACSSAANNGLVNAFEARAFLGWERPPDMNFASNAAQVFFDEATDKARSARNAWSMWGRYQRFLEIASGRKRPDRTKVDILKAFGPGGFEYPRMADQTVILIYRIRHGPASASSDIAKSVSVVKACSDQFWSAGTSTGLKSPACHQLEFGSHLPTNEEVADAIFDAGGGGDQPYGRWTMAD
ncbi:MAG: hypothetical protein HY873_04745 [Chloroflexi bacterium]|nr:hypothetical protein [Chloroflexota bacterium]